MKRQIKAMEEKYKDAAMGLVEEVFTRWRDGAEGRAVRRLAEEIRAKKYYVPALELIMTDGEDAVVGYAMFSRFHLEGRYESRLLLLSPVAVKTDLQRRHISKELLEYGFRRAEELGFTAVIVEGDPKTYVPRGFQPSYLFGIEAGPGLRLPHPDCLMAKELRPGALEHISGTVDYSFYDALREE